MAETATLDKPAKAAASESARITVHAGQFIQLQRNGKGEMGWFKCTDVNQRLSRDLCAIAVAVADFEYEAGVGSPNNVVKNFTLRKFYTHPAASSPTGTERAYDEAWLAKYFADLRARGKGDIVNEIEPTIRAGCREFERQYKPKD